MIKTDILSEIGQYRASRIRTLIRLLEKRKISYDVNELIKLSKSEITSKIISLTGKPLRNNGGESGRTNSLNNQEGSPGDLTV